MAEFAKEDAQMLATLDPSTFARRDSGYAEALERATEVRPLKDRSGVIYAWLFLPSRNTWPTWHINRPAPTPGCGCGCEPCHRPQCCRVWSEPVVLSTGEMVAWICPTCLERVKHP